MSLATCDRSSQEAVAVRRRYAGIRITTNGKHLVGYGAEARSNEGVVLFSNTTSSQRDESLHPRCAEGKLDAFGQCEQARVVADADAAAQGPVITSSGGRQPNDGFRLRLGRGVRARIR